MSTNIIDEHENNKKRQIEEVSVDDGKNCSAKAMYQVRYQEKSRGAAGQISKEKRDEGSTQDPRGDNERFVGNGSKGRKQHDGKYASRKKYLRLCHLFLQTIQTNDRRTEYVIQKSKDKIAEHSPRK